MNRSGYVDDGGDDLALGRWRAQVASAIRGKRGQRFIRDLITALDAMPEKKLIEGAFQTDGGCCAAGAVGRLRGVDMSGLNPPEDDLEYYDAKEWNIPAAEVLDVAVPLIAEVEWVNDEGYSWRGDDDGDEARWKRVRDWATRQLKEQG